MVNPQEAIIEGPIVPYTRMTQRGKWSKTAQRYLASQEAMAWQFKAQMQPFPPKALLDMALGFEMPQGWLKKDLSNLIKAVEDALQLAGIIDNDSRIVAISGASKQPGPEDRATVVLMEWTP